MVAARVVGGGRTAATARETVQVTGTLPMAALRAALAPETVDPGRRTAELVWTTGARVRRHDWWTGETWYEELAVTEEAVDLGRLRAGAPLLAAHQSYSLDGIIGVVEDAWLADGAGHARVRFSENQRAEAVFTDVKAAIIRNVSVGYVIHELEELERKKNEPRVYRAIRWEPMEVSFVAVGADAGAGVRGGDAAERYPCLVRRSPMPKPQNPLDPTQTRQDDDDDENGDQGAGDKPKGDAAGGGDKPKDEGGGDKPKDEAAAGAGDQARAERDRVQGILKAARQMKLPDKIADDLIARGVPLEAARSAILRELEKQTPPIGGVIQVGDDGAMGLRAAITAAVLHRTDPVRYPLRDGLGKDFVGLSLLDMAKDCLEVRGIRWRGLARDRIAGVAIGMVRPDGNRSEGFLSTSDFPAAMLTAARTTLSDGFTGAPRTFPPWTRRGTLPDYRAMNRIALGMAPKLLKVPEHGEYVHGKMDAHAEQIRLEKWGRILALTREAIINDDLDAFTGLAIRFGYAAAAMEGDAVYGLLTGNPPMSDGQPLFSAAHGNLAPAAAIDLASMTVARNLMSTQKSSDGQFLTITPRFLIVGPLLETAAYQFTSSTVVPTQPSGVIPQQFKSLEVVVDPRIVDASWYLAASPAQVDTIEYAYMDGEPGPQIESRDGWAIDGVDYKCREDFGAAVIEYRGLVKTQSASTFEAMTGQSAELDVKAAKTANRRTTEGA